MKPAPHNNGSLALVQRIRPAAHVVYGSLFIIALLAVVLGLANVTRFRALPEDERSFGLRGSVKGRLFSAPFAAGHFGVGASGSLRINLDNTSTATYRLILRAVPTERREIQVPPGLTKLKLRPGRGPVYLEFRWDRLPAGVVLNTVQSSEYRRFRNLMILLGTLGALTGLFFFLAAVLERLEGRRRAATCLFFLLFAVYFFVFDRALIPLTGDEPHYLVLAESLLRDGDIVLENNYQSTWRHGFYPGSIDRHTTGTPAGEIASHYPGLAVVLAPAMAGPAMGVPVDPYTAGKIIMIIFAALTGSVVFARVMRVARRGTPRLVAGLFTLLAFLSLPFLAYSNQIYPEPLAGLLLFWIVSGLYNRSLHPPRPGRPFPGGGLFRMTIPVMLLPWLNIKFALPALLCGCYLLWLSRGVPRRLLFTSIFLLGGAIAVVLYTIACYGALLGPYNGQQIVTRDFWTRYGTYLFDADRGLFALQPLLLWALPGMALFWRRSRPFVILLIAVLAASHLPNIFQDDERNWLLGYCPAGRYWIAAFPLLVWCGARGVAGITRWPRRNLIMNGLRLAAILLSPFGFLIGLTQSLSFRAFQEGVYLPLRQTGNAARFAQDNLGIDMTWIFAHHPFDESLAALEGWLIVALVFALLAMTMGTRRLKIRTRSGN